jgi:hypothetical protein
MPHFCSWEIWNLINLLQLNSEKAFLLNMDLRHDIFRQSNYYRGAVKFENNRTMVQALWKKMSLEQKPEQQAIQSVRMIK